MNIKFMYQDNQKMTGGHVGTYSVSVKSFFNSWKNKKPIEIEKKKTKTLKPILYPIFEKCADLTEDKFWKSIFMDCSRGKFPRGFSFKNNLITHRKGNKMTRLEISNSAMETYTSTMEFFQKLAGIMSEKDRLKLKKLEEERLIEEMSSKEITWKDVKTEKLKDILISEFIDSISQRLELNQSERNDLITTIKKGFLLKYFTSSNIYMEKGKIVEIEGLIIHEETKESEIDPDYMVSKSSRVYHGLGIEKEDAKPDIDFLDIWEKYLSSLETKRVKRNQTYSASYSNTTNNNIEDSEDQISTTF